METVTGRQFVAGVLTLVVAAFYGLVGLLACTYLVDSPAQWWVVGFAAWMMVTGTAYWLASMCKDLWRWALKRGQR